MPKCLFISKLQTLHSTTKILSKVLPKEGYIFYQTCYKIIIFLYWLKSISMKIFEKENIRKKDVPDPFLVCQRYHSCCLTSGFDEQWQDYLRKMISPDMVSSFITAGKSMRIHSRINEKESSAQKETVAHFSLQASLETKTRKQIPSWRGKACHVCQEYPNEMTQGTPHKIDYAMSKGQLASF